MYYSNYLIRPLLFDGIDVCMRRTKNKKERKLYFINYKN